MSRFVSAGTDQAPIERDADWLAAQQELEANRRRKEEEKSQQADGRSLYEILQANKAAKQEAFEESIRLKNQFRSLDNDEVDFLDSVLESTREKEAKIKRETEEQLDLFRRQREEAERAERAQEAQGEDGQGAADTVTVWQSAGRRKRKTGEKEAALRGVKVRRVSSSAGGGEKSVDEASPSAAAGAPLRLERPASSVKSPEEQGGVVLGTSAVIAAQKQLSVSESQPPAPQKQQVPAVPPAKSSPSASASAGLGLGAYSSDED